MLQFASMGQCVNWLDSRGHEKLITAFGLCNQDGLPSTMVQVQSIQLTMTHHRVGTLKVLGLNCCLEQTPDTQQQSRIDSCFNSTDSNSINVQCQAGYLWMLVNWN